MEPASILLAAASVLGTKAVEESTKLAVAELWSSLKSLVKGKRGVDSPALEVINEIEHHPAQTPPTPPTPMLSARVAALQLAEDPDIGPLLQRVEALLAQKAPGHIEKQYFISGTFHNTTFN